MSLLSDDNYAAVADRPTHAIVGLATSARGLRSAGASATFVTLKQKSATVPAASTFAVEAEDVLRPLHAGLRALVASLPGPIDKPIDLQRTLGVDAKFAWQVFKFVQATNLLPASGNLPGVAAIQKFLDRADAAGVAPSIIAGVAGPLAAFKQFVAARAGGRQVFNSMVAGGSDAAAVNLMHRKAAFRAGAHFMGVQTETNYICFAFNAAPDRSGQWDSAVLIYRVGVQRLRPDAIVTIAHVGNYLPPDAGGDRPWFEPVEPNGDLSRTNNLIPDFCTDAHADVVAVERPDYGIRLQLAPGRVGMTETTNWASGVVKRNTADRPLPGRMVPVIVDVGGAMQNLIVDVLFDAEAVAEPATRVKTFMGYFNSTDNTHDRSDDERMAIHEQIVNAGLGTAALRDSNVPRADEFVAHAFGRLGWDVERFRVHRCRVAYPVIGSSLSMAFSIPDFGGRPSQPTTSDDGSGRR